MIKLFKRIKEKIMERRSAHKKIKTDLKSGMNYRQAIMNNKMELESVWEQLK